MRQILGPIHPSIPVVSWALFPRRKTAEVLKLNTDFRLAPKLSISGDMIHSIIYLHGVHRTQLLKFPLLNRVAYMPDIVWRTD